MTTFTKDELEKLPVWARDKIATLEATATVAAAFVQSIQDANPKSRIEYQPWTGIEHPKLNAPNDSTFQFFLGDNPHRQDWIQVCLPYHFKRRDRYPSAIQLRGSGRIAVFHDASNSAIITLADQADQLIKDGAI